MIHTSQLSRIFNYNDLTGFDGYLCIGFGFCILCVLWRLWFQWKVKVNCWFCGYDNVIPRYSKVWWRCETCDQYNGFKKNGDYFKEVPGMHNMPYTPPKFCAIQGCVKTKKILCTNCTQNQTLIIDALRNFSPTDDRYFEEELERYKHELNSRWDLCIPCRTHVAYHIQDQDKQITQVYCDNNSTVKKNEKGARRLNVKLASSNMFIFGIYKLAHLLSLVAVIWLWGQLKYTQKTDFVLINACLIFISSTILVYMKAKTCDMISCFVSLMWSLVVLYGNFKTKDSRYLRKVLFTGLIFTEGLYLCNEILHLFINLWKWITYKQERKDKISRIRDSPKGKLAQSSTPESEKELNISNKQSQISVNGNLPKSDVSIPRRPSTPDLLEGHLDAMYIQRREELDSSPARDKDTNHVVAALKYSSSSHTQLHHRVSGQVLRPATFSAQSSPAKYSGKLLRPPTFVSTDDFKKGRDIFTLSKMKITDLKKQTSSNETVNDRGHINKDVTEKKNVETSQLDKKTTKPCSWSAFIIIFFIFSVVCNIILAYKLTSIGGL